MSVWWESWDCMIKMLSDISWQIHAQLCLKYCFYCSEWPSLCASWAWPCFLLLQPLRWVLIAGQSSSNSFWAWKSQKMGHNAKSCPGFKIQTNWHFLLNWIVLAWQTVRKLFLPWFQWLHLDCERLTWVVVVIVLMLLSTHLGASTVRELLFARHDWFYYTSTKCAIPDDMCCLPHVHVLCLA